MTAGESFAEMIELVGVEMASGEGSESARTVGTMLAETGTAPLLVTSLFAEARKPRPREDMIEAYAHILRFALDSLRVNANGGDTSARRTAEAMIASIDREIGSKPAEPALLMILARSIAMAGLEPGAALQRTMGEMLDGGGFAGSGPDASSTEDPTGDLEELARTLGFDSFAIHTEIAASLSAFPESHRAVLMAALVTSKTAAVRQAALGFVLDPSEAIAARTLALLREEGHKLPVPSLMVERLVHMRPWLPESRRAALDETVRALRPKAQPPATPPKVRILDCLATPADGAGALGLFVLVKRGRSLALVSVLTKADVGIAEAFVLGDLDKGEAEAMVSRAALESGAEDVSMAFIAARLRHALALGFAGNRPPPFGLLEAVETLGLGPLHPEPLTPAALAERLLESVSGPDAEEAARAYGASTEWLALHDFTESWFEAGEAVEALLRPIKGRKKRAAAVLETLLPARRPLWAERCAWTAAVLKESAEEGDDDWIPFALAARDLAGEEPGGAVPVLRWIAEATAEAFASL